MSSKTVISGSRPFPTHQNPYVRFLLNFAEFSKADPEPAVKEKNEQGKITEILPEGRPGNESGELAVCCETRRFLQLETWQKDG